ncbi:MAG: MBOAT family protein [Bacilli bacterium]|nr:MBOAT family protein [Bacilli bacterium]
MKAYEQLIYLVIFATIVYLFYMIFFKKYRYIVLIVGSLILLFVASKFMGFFVILSSLIVYVFALIISNRTEKTNQKKDFLEKEEFKKLKQETKKVNKCYLSIGLILNLGLLIGLKYVNFFDSFLNNVFGFLQLELEIPYLNILLPIGISYYTLSNTGYLIDVYRSKYQASKNYLDVLLFTSYFPCLLEGPISHYDYVLPQLKEGHSFRFDNFKRGVLCILVGLFKKIVIADRLSILVVACFDKELTGPILILGIIGFTFQLYAEFSGIIDMVRGISKMYGIEIEKNFEQPFFSSSVGEFWRRWHISLGTWFKEYVFYPLSMSKFLNFLCKKLKGKVPKFWETFIPSCIVLFVVWSLTGLWHGASWKYLGYGLYYYFIMMLETVFSFLFKKKKTSHVFIRFLKIIKTFILVNIGMLIFRCNRLTDVGMYIMRIFQPNSQSFNEVFAIHELIISILALTILLIFEYLQTKKIVIQDYLFKMPIFARYSAYLILIFSIIIFGAYGLGYLPPDPIYGGF